MKKNLAAYRYIDEKLLSLYVSDATAGSTAEGFAHRSSIDLMLKRVLDIAISAFVLVFGFPFYALLGVLIKLTSKGPVLFVQQRVGVNAKPFRMYKFRTMINGNSDDAHRNFAENFIKGTVEYDDEADAPVFKLTGDPRVTPIGRFLRRTSLDELPQLINVLKGEMSIVGPRPPLKYEIDHYKEWHKKRLAVKPGMTGLWQVSGRSMVPFEEMVALDLYYIENWSLPLDIKILFRTLPAMFTGTGAY